MIEVAFQPDGLIARIPKGETIQKAAEEVGIILNIPCGGHGRCGKCKVLVTKGQTSEKGLFHKDHFSDEEIKFGHRLACQTKVEEAIDVLIPIESRVTNQKILIQSLPVKYENNPNIWQINLPINPPDEESNIADADRLLNALAKHGPKQNISIPFEVLHSLPKTLREKNWQVRTILQETTNGIEIQEVIPGKTRKRLLGLAIDIGTTTIASTLFNLETGKIIDSASTFNSQMLYGEDVITRIHYASINKENLKKLQSLVVRDINQLLKSFDVKSDDIRMLTITGNTVMTHLVSNIDPSFIWREPYTPAVNQLPLIKAKQLGINAHELANVFVLPCVSSYIGGDVIGSILVSKLHLNEKPSILVDIGTNGEIVLGCNSWILSCSVPAGPALEGAEVKCGMRAAYGAIDKISINPDTFEIDYSVIGNCKPIGICGSGLIDLLAELFTMGLVTKSGKLCNVGTERIYETEQGLEFLIVSGKETTTEKDIVLTELDVSNLLKTKGAFYAGYTILLRSFELSFEDLDSFYVAGGFGNHINAQNAITIGLYPDIPLDKIKFIGNGSLGGASLALLSKDAKKEATELAKSVTNIELSNNYDFMDEYTLASFIPHTHLELFPSVRKFSNLGGIQN